MSDLSSGSPLPSRDAQEFRPGPPWPLPPSDQQNDASSRAAVALAILSEKIKSGALQRTELMQRLVAQAIAATGAKGVALALRRAAGDPVVCCAATGDMAPPPGTTLDEGSGFTAECLRNGVVMICEDSEMDTRVDRVACTRLGVRSIVAAPVESEGSIVGVLEALSDQPAAFSKQHIEALLTLACFAKSAITPVDSDSGHIPLQDLAAVPAPLKSPEPAAEPEAFRDRDLMETIEATQPWSERVPRRVRLAIMCGVAAAVLLALVATAVFVWMWRHSSDTEMGKAPQAKPQPSASAKPPAGTGASLPARGPGMHRQDHQNGIKPLVVKASAVEKMSSGDSGTPAGGAPIPPSAAEDNTSAPAPFTPLGTGDAAGLSSVLSSPERLPSPVVATSEGVRPARLEHRVEPLYPAEAKRLRIEGPVVLRAAIDEEGKIKSLRLVNGSPILAQAAIAAVRQWRYQPSELNHRVTASTTDITIVFHLQ
jgi:TonB family protein